MESMNLKNGKVAATPVKDRSGSRSSENANPNVKSPLVRSASLKKSAHKNPAGFSPRNRIRERRFVVVAKKNSKKGKKENEIDCKCGERKKGNMKCVCVAYETLRASQEEFFKKRSETDEGSDDVGGPNAEEVEGGEEQNQTGAATMKRRREKVRRSVPESGKVMNLVEAFEKLTCFSASKTADKRQEDQTEEQHNWSSSFCPSELVLTAKNLGLDPDASVSSSWDSSHRSVLSGNSNAGRRSRRNVCGLDPLL